MKANGPWPRRQQAWGRCSVHGQPPAVCAGPSRERARPRAPWPASAGAGWVGHPARAWQRAPGAARPHLGRGRRRSRTPLTQRLIWRGDSGGFVRGSSLRNHGGRSRREWGWGPLRTAAGEGRQALSRAGGPAHPALCAPSTDADEGDWRHHSAARDSCHRCTQPRRSHLFRLSLGSLVGGIPFTHCQITERASSCRTKPQPSSGGTARSSRRGESRRLCGVGLIFFFLSANGLLRLRFFSRRILASEKNNAKFNFLLPGDPYHAYYRQKVRELNAEKTPHRSARRRTERP